jgi:hypothetical protein
MLTTEASELVEKVLGDWIAPARLTRVIVSEEVDSDGDNILSVRAVYDSSAPPPEAEKMFSATRLIRMNLGLEGELRFPLLSFVSSDDAKGLAA